ncbi:lysophosphatidic acid receptor 6-like [Hyperolius riggenbachi]|uniref:lysophosphatidic acid receptor 6-like n=1 Tax=Hyperolius riggenbachi TaxID=752182 RepID=UPI0035A32B78
MMLNSSGNITGCQPQPINPFIPIFLSFIFFTGFVLNCISLWIFWFKVKQWNAMVVLQFNLAISDAVVTPAVPLLITYALTDKWSFGVFLCQSKVFIMSIHVYGSIYFLTLISIHRYFSITRNVKRKALTSKPFIKKICLIIWSLLICQGIPSFFFLKTSEIDGVKKCFNIHENEQTNLMFVWTWVSVMSGLLIPLSVMLACYSLLIRHLIRVKPMNTLSKIVLSKSVLTIFVSLIIFIICSIPSNIARVVAVTIAWIFPSYCSWLENAEDALNFTATIQLTNCLMDPILYCFASDKYRATFTSLCTFWCPSLQRQHQENIKVSDSTGQTEESKNIQCTVLITMDSSETRPATVVEWEN